MEVLLTDPVFVGGVLFIGVLGLLMFIAKEWFS